MNHIFSEETIAILGEKLSKAHVSTRVQSGITLSYIEAHHAAREANRAFGHDGWHRETYNLNLVQAEQKSEKWYISYTAQCKVTVQGVVRVGTGFGQGIDRDMGKAHESAIKEAESDAMKRALMTFGDIFGLALYDKAQTNVAPVEEPKPKKHSPEGQTEARGFLASLNLDPEQSKTFTGLLKEKGLTPTPTVLMAKAEDVKTFEELMEYVSGL
jgi:DNA repair and recombination protein RAD52